MPKTMNMARSAEVIRNGCVGQRVLKSPSTTRRSGRPSFAYETPWAIAETDARPVQLRDAQGGHPQEPVPGHCPWVAASVCERSVSRADGYPNTGTRP